MLQEVHPTNQLAGRRTKQRLTETPTTAVACFWWAATGQGISHGTPQHGLSSNTMALFTSDCGSQGNHIFLGGIETSLGALLAGTAELSLQVSLQLQVGITHRDLQL